MTCATRSHLEHAHLIYGFSSPLAPRWLFREPAGPWWLCKGYCWWSSAAHTTLWAKCEGFPPPPNCSIVDTGSSESLLHICSAKWIVTRTSVILLTECLIQSSAARLPPTTRQTLAKGSCARCLAKEGEGENSIQDWLSLCFTDPPRFCQAKSFLLSCMLLLELKSYC